MIVILLSGKEWVLRHPYGDDAEVHYTQRRVKGRALSEVWNDLARCARLIR